MIDGFEEITAKLTEAERLLVGEFSRVLAKKIGVANAVTSKTIIAGYQKRGVKLSGSRVRKILNYIRMNSLVEGLVANSKGYYVTRDPATLMKYNTSLEQREAAIRAVRKKNELYLSKILRNGENQGPEA